MATEEPRYKVSMTSGMIEIRDYPELIAAQVTVGGDRSAAGGAGFRLLAGYIFGGNVSAKSIAMTAPVVQARAKPETIAMTAPVLQSADKAGWVVQFIMPSGYTLATLPKPKDARVHLKVLPPSRTAVARFSGLTLEGDVARETRALEAFLKSKNLRPAGPAALARYDPPWTPWFMRRNEIWIPLEP